MRQLGIFGPTGIAGEMPGFLHYGFRAVGTTVVPPNLPGSTLRPVVRLVRSRYLFARSPVTQTGTSASAGRAPSSLPTVSTLSTSSTFSGASGWIPAGNNGAPQGSQGVRGVRFENDYLFRGWRADTSRRQGGLFETSR